MKNMISCSNQWYENYNRNQQVTKNAQHWRPLTYMQLILLLLLLLSNFI
jgi:hypothetical protein